MKRCHDLPIEGQRRKVALCGNATALPYRGCTDFGAERCGGRSVATVSLGALELETVGTAQRDLNGPVLALRRHGCSYLHRPESGDKRTPYS